MVSQVTKAVVPVLVVLLGAWFVSDPRGVADVAGDGSDRAWDVTSGAVSSAITYLRER